MCIPRKRQYIVPENAHRLLAVCDQHTLHVQGQLILGLDGNCVQAPSKFPGLPISYYVATDHPPGPNGQTQLTAQAKAYDDPLSSSARMV